MTEKKRDRDSFVNELKKSHDRILLVGSGTFGEVFVAEDKTSKKMVAIKRLRQPSENKQQAAEAYKRVMEKEIQTTQSIPPHPNIMAIQSLIKINENDCVLMDCMSHDLGGLITNSSRLHMTHGQIKCYAKQLATGIAFLHASGILHRDLKPANILVSSNHIVKIGDFGLACTQFQGKIHEDCEVVSLWYRAPEVLMRSRVYGFEIDVWSFGCILVEMIQKKPFLAGTNPTDQAQLIYELLGTPWSNGWPECRHLPGWIRQESNLQHIPRRNLTEHFKSLSREVDTYHYFTTEAVRLIDRVFTFHPDHRIRMADVLDHPYFTGERPEPCQPEQLMRTQVGESFYSTLVNKKK